MCPRLETNASSDERSDPEIKLRQESGLNVPAIKLIVIGRRSEIRDPLRQDEAGMNVPAIETNASSDEQGVRGSVTAGGAGTNVPD
jgi:hypothetical protein